MAFLTQNNNTIFLEINDENKKKLVRPLAVKPICIWGHAFPSPEILVQVPGGEVEKARLRDYFFHVCTAIDRIGTGCMIHNTQDPAWQYLPQRDQTNKKGHRVDFPMRPHWLLPVWSYADSMIKVIRNSGQVYEGMDQWDTEGRDIRECDWQVWFKQQGQDKRNRTYKSQRMDSAKFTIEIPDEQIKAAWDEAKKEYLPLPPEKLREKMLCLTPDEASKKFLAARAESVSFNPAQLSAADQPGASPFPPMNSGQPQLPATTQPASAPATTTPATSSQPADVSSMLANLSPEQLRQMATLLQAQKVAGGEPVQSVGSSAPPDGGEVQPPLASSSPKAQEAPVSTPAAVAPNGNPLEYVLESGKYKGKRLAEVVQVDPKYLVFFRSTQSESVKAIITAAIEAKPVMPPSTPTQPSTPAPVASAPAQSVPVSTTTPPAAAATTEQPTADKRTALVAECKGLLMQIPEFKGKGMGDNMMPFLRAVSGGKFDYTEWNIPELEKLQAALVKKLAESQARTQQTAAAS